MQKLSLKKISILGLVLMGASAVTAAVLPSKSEQKLAPGNAGFNTQGSWTCSAVAGGAACDRSDSGTTVAGDTSGFPGTAGNTED